jgi:hypothetical protein
MIALQGQFVVAAVLQPLDPRCAHTHTRKDPFRPCPGRDLGSVSCDSSCSFGLAVLDGCWLYLPPSRIACDAVLLDECWQSLPTILRPVTSALVGECYLVANAGCRL